LIEFHRRETEKHFPAGSGGAVVVYMVVSLLVMVIALVAACQSTSVDATPPILPQPPGVPTAVHTRVKLLVVLKYLLPS
jgi:hypothetical protein